MDIPQECSRDEWTIVRNADTGVSTIKIGDECELDDILKNIIFSEVKALRLIRKEMLQNHLNPFLTYTGWKIY